MQWRTVRLCIYAMFFLNLRYFNLLTAFGVFITILYECPFFFFFFNDPPPSEIYTLPLHDALPISSLPMLGVNPGLPGVLADGGAVGPELARRCVVVPAVDAGGRRGGRPDRGRDHVRGGAQVRI